MVMNPTARAGEDLARVTSGIAAAIKAGDLNRAYEIANWALGRGLTSRIIFNAHGLGLQASGRHHEAIEDFRRALEYSPNDPTIHNALGMSYLALERAPRAIESFEAAIAAAPDIAVSHHRLGLALAMHGKHAESKAAHERAVEINPNFAEAIANLATHAARTKKLKEAEAHADRALALNPQTAVARYALVLVAMAEKRYSDAESILRDLLKDDTLSSARHVMALGSLGDALEGQGRYAEAFEAYRIGNEITYREHSHRFERNRGGDAIRYMTAYFEKASPASWRAPDEGEIRPDGPDEHVFLLGFMRSGTTLLEQVLASNPRVVALEEKPLLNELAETYTTGVASLDRLAAIEGSELADVRREYWERVATHAGSIKGKVFVDKHPLNTVKLPLIAKLFPKAKILFALRDPRDVVFSCYRRHFRVTSAMIEFLNLHDAAGFYAGIMNLGDIYRRILPLNLLEHRYEDMVADFEGRVRAVCDFIGVEWSDSMREFNKHAPTPDLRSPSASQVQQPLYAEGVAQWRNYAEQLAPIMPILAPWVEKFGYPAA
jgi:tetratricopeptide (TPR) repeat protein